MKSQIKNLNDRINKQRSRITQLNAALEKAEGANIKLHLENEKLRVKYTDALKENVALTKRIAKLELDLANVDANLAHDEKELADLHEIIHTGLHGISRKYGDIRHDLPVDIPYEVRDKMLPGCVLAGLYSSDFRGLDVTGTGLAWLQDIPHSTYSPIDVLNKGFVEFWWPVGPISQHHLHFPRWFNTTYDPDPPHPSQHKSGLVNSLMTCRFTTAWQYGDPGIRPLFEEAFNALESRLMDIFTLLDLCTAFVEDISEFAAKQRTSSVSRRHSPCITATQSGS